MLKRLVVIAGWLIVGLVGSAMILMATVVVAERAVPVRLPSLHVFTTMWDEFVSAKGSWVMENDRQASPLQTSEIACRRASMECTGVQADLLFGMLNAFRETYKITRWDAEFLSFQTSNSCVIYNYTIERVSKRVFGTRTKVAIPTDACDAVVPGPIQLSLTDGLIVQERLRAETWAKASPFMWIAFGVLWFLVLAKIWLSIRGHRPRQLLTT